MLTVFLPLQGINCSTHKRGTPGASVKGKESHVLFGGCLGSFVSKREEETELLGVTCLMLCVFRRFVNHLDQS